ncbi:uncharacterized protein LOC134667732 [Cydia fagiglandana]|uniref:uncharacterized protein LOC134667732 n=1 Tax=Cydia fagiglandana TaxID=1458189 RepID=UPI002FEE3597
MIKCTVCQKSVTKKTPALTCSRCDNVVHEKTDCSGLTNKQRTALHAAETLEWVCRDCHLSSTRRTSFLSAVEDEDEDDEEAARAVAPSLNLKKLLDNISKEVHKIVMRELDELTKSARHASDKIDEFEESARASKERIKHLERQNSALKNQNTHLETRVAALEQRVDAIEQAAMVDCVEMIGVPLIMNEDTVKIAQKVGMSLKTLDSNNMNSIRSARRLPSRDGKSGAILVQLSDSETKLRWISAARNADLLASSLLPDLTGTEAVAKITLREALTGRTKYLLFQAKSKLRDTQKFKYVWCKHGKVFARKGDKDKIYWVRNEKDIEELVK